MNVNSHNFREEVIAAVRHLQKRLTADSVLIHGSQVTGLTDSLSDIDIIFAVRNGRQSHGYVLECGFWMDYKCHTFARLREDLDKPYTRNAIPLLNALANGVVIHDYDEMLSQLQQYAKDLWIAGPAKPDRRELLSIETEIKKMVHNAEHAFARSAQSRLPKNLAQIKIDQMFFGIVGRYQRLHQLWSANLISMYRQCEFNAPNLFDLIEEYISTSDESRRLQVLQALGDRCLSFICASLDEQSFVAEYGSARRHLRVPR